MANFLTRLFKRRAVAEAVRREPIVVRTYQAAIAYPVTYGWASPNDSADAQLAAGLQRLRGRARELVRNGAYAKRARVIVVNNVIGSGMGLQALVQSTRGTPIKRINDGIEDAWVKWSRAESCHTGGSLTFAELERAAMGCVFDAGECFLRVHRSRFGDSAVPLALELVEPERVPDAAFPSDVNRSNNVRMGVELDEFHRPLAYWVRRRHQGDLSPQAFSNPNAYERVPAADMFHLRIIDRWPQTRGEPWLHAAARRLWDMDRYSEAEIVAARGAASYLATIETPDPDSPLAGQTNDANDNQERQTVPLEPGMSVRLAPGEKLNFNNPNRPNPAMDPFMRMMLREVAAGVGSSYESLSRDYSQSNYSSSRLALLDDRDCWRVFQQWWKASFREPFHRQWLLSAVYARAIEQVPLAQYLQAPDKFERARFKARGWSWVDPEKEVNAYKEAILNGFMTLSDVIELTGQGDDLEDKLERRKAELDLMQEYGLTFATNPQQPAAASPGQPDGAAAGAPPDDGSADGGGADGSGGRGALRAVGGKGNV